MKRLVCESCGDVNLVKEDGLYVCQSCGTKYEINESGMLKVHLNVNLNGSSGDAEQAARYLALAINAHTAENFQESGRYAQMVLEIDPEQAMPWFLKGESVGWASSLARPRMKEAIQCFAQAMRYCRKKDQSIMRQQISATMTALVIGHSGVYRENFFEQPVKALEEKLLGCLDEIKGYEEQLKTVCGVGLGDYQTACISNINRAACSVWCDKTYPEYQKCFDTNSRPDRHEWRRFRDQVSSCINLLRYAAGQPGLTREDEILFLKNQAHMMTELVQSRAEKWVSSKNISGWVLDESLPPSQSKAMIEEIMKCHHRIHELDPEYQIPKKPSAGCYIATAVYGHYNCPQVRVLRRYRDLILAKSWWGRAFICVYYAISPTLVALFGQNRAVLSVGKRYLDHFVMQLKQRGLTDHPYQDVNRGDI